MQHIIERIHAVKQPFNIAAAKATPDYRGVEHLIRAAKIDINGQLTVSELDAKLAKTQMAISERMMLKSALGRSGVLK